MSTQFFDRAKKIAKIEVGFVPGISGFHVLCRAMNTVWKYPSRRVDRSRSATLRADFFRCFQKVGAKGIEFSIQLSVRRVLAINTDAAEFLFCLHDNEALVRVHMIELKERCYLFAKAEK